MCDKMAISSYIFKLGENDPLLKGTSGRKKSYDQMKEREKCKKNEPSPTSIHQMVLEIFHLKVRNLGKMDIAIL